MTNKNSKKPRRLLQVLVGLGIGAVLVLAVCSVFYFREKLLDLGISDSVKIEKYGKHYALITSNVDLPFWESVYEETKAEAKKHNAYVEYIGKGLSVNYNTAQLLRIAIDCSVDGIIVEGSDSPEVMELINEAVKKNITVITVLKDSPKSARQCFVGINNYQLGKTYGEQVLKIWNKNMRRVLVLMDSNNPDTNQNIIYSSIKETIQKDAAKSKNLDIQTVTVNNENAFSSEEAIRDIIMDTRHLPDVMICLNSIDTQCAYQAVVDHNKVGQVEILGYYSSADIISAIQKEIIHSTISVDAKQMGALCIKALDEYSKTGRTSNYFPVDTQLITLDTFGKYLKREN